MGILITDRFDYWIIVYAYEIPFVNKNEPPPYGDACILMGDGCVLPTYTLGGLIESEPNVGKTV